MNEVFIASALRTPIGRYGGALSAVRADDLVGDLLRTLIERTKIDPAAVGDVYLGATNQAGDDNRDVARMAVLLAGLPTSVPGVTVNRLCGSGLEAVNQAARVIQLGEADLVIAGGVESMTRAPFVFAKPTGAYDRTPPQVYDTTIGWRFTNPRLEAQGYTLALGETAEVVAERYGISREAQDRFALESQQRTAAAQAAGHFNDEIVPVTIPAKRKGQPATVFAADEHPRPDTTFEALAGLRPAFREGGSVTAGNSSGVNDGAALLLLASAAGIERYGLQPLARIVGSAVAGVDPQVMGLGPIPATRRVLQRAGLDVEALDLIELNEAFASQALVCMQELHFDPAKVNVNGGAIALGHPLGASGARILTTLLHELRRRGGRYGLATMCIGVGQGIATVIEALEA
jgi:3-oxoadipyl-CoA thiolase